ncbi:IclR family transcriptional regulator [Rhodospira trueperi]|uniref:IclR family transcriptional regulator n=1 Tax=Rhodospira trueperi TaxID=69960 RepID=UPI0015A2B831|nr:IclR family transcriptional regulator [Rhodospira trueperi]
MHFEKAVGIAMTTYSAVRPQVLSSTLEKGLRILRLFRSTQDGLSLSEITRLTGLEKSAAQRLTYTLHGLGYLDRDERTRRYGPGLKMLDLSYAYLIHDDLLERALPRMLETSRAMNIAVNLGVLDGTEVLYKYRIPHSAVAFDNALIGVRQPAPVTAIGQVIAAFSDADVLDRMLSAGLPEPVTPYTLQDPEIVRRRVAQAKHDGFVISVQQVMLQEIAVAAPILGPDRTAVAAISMPVYMPEWDEDRVRRDLVAPITAAARAISSKAAG